jgi:phage tail-like protein
MARTNRTDPLRNFKFRVQIHPIEAGLQQFTTGIGDIGFAQMSGVSVQNELIGYREGGMNTHPHKLVGQSDFTPISFARGVFANQSQLWQWQKFIHAWVGGGTSGIVGGSNGSSDRINSEDYRADILVRVYDHPITNNDFTYQPPPGIDETNPDTNASHAKLGIKIYNAWPGSFVLSDLNAGDNGIMIQQVQLHHEGFELFWGSEVANMTDNVN